MQVFIAENNFYELERLRRLIQSWGSRHDGVNITAMQSVTEVSAADLRAYDAVFLDVELPGKDGFAFAQELRDEGCSASIVFVTNHSELSLKGYTVHAQDYVIKPVEQERSAGAKAPTDDAWGYERAVAELDRLNIPRTIARFARAVDGAKEERA